MGVEIERKFLPASDGWRAHAQRSRRMVQGYLIDAGLINSDSGVRCSLRVRVAGEEAWLNIKSSDLGISRIEYDYPIPVADAERMIQDFCNGVVEKTRHYVPVDDFTFEVDEFHGDNDGLIVAELELDSVDRVFPRPGWLGKEVSGALRYYNLNLLHHPYSRWNASERHGD
jgi:adenylate cyclase